VSAVDDRIALRDLVDAYARYADRRDPRRQAEVFTPDGRVTLFDGDPAVHPRFSRCGAARRWSRRFRG